MGWARGTDVALGFIEAVRPAVRSEAARKRIYLKVIETLNEQAWDTQNEVLGEDPAFDAALRETDPDLFEDEDVPR